jgi:hypothetical protein
MDTFYQHIGGNDRLLAEVIDYGGIIAHAHYRRGILQLHILGKVPDKAKFAEVAYLCSCFAHGYFF